MVQHFIIHEHTPRLLLFFAGWGADATPFQMYRPKGSDFLICYDYRTLAFDVTCLNEYSEINLIGWSMGVWAASQVMVNFVNRSRKETYSFRMGRSVAINGTPYPIDDYRGIPTAIYNGTLEGLTGASLHKFLRRMCADAKAFRKFLEVTPRRPLEELRDELIAVKVLQKCEQGEKSKESCFQWQQAVVGKEDRIIPPKNQLQAWREMGTPVIETDNTHYEQSLFQYYLQDIWIND